MTSKTSTNIDPVTAGPAPKAAVVRRGQGSYSEQRNALKLWTGLLPFFAKRFAESKALLLASPTIRTGWRRDTLVNTFEDLLMAAGVSTYSDGSNACLGAYMSFYDFTAARVVCEEFTDPELEALRTYYEATTYLSPIFGLVKGSCRDELERRAKAREVTLPASPNADRKSPLTTTA